VGPGHSNDPKPVRNTNPVSLTGGGYKDGGGLVAAEVRYLGPKEKSMEEKAVTMLSSNLLALLGYIRLAHIKICALEDLLKEVSPLQWERYRLLAQSSENDSRTALSLEDLPGLQAALRRDRG
jgi:hypothetical protein